MKQASTVRPGVVRIEEAPDPVPRPGEVVLAVRAAGVCGSDVNLFNGAHPYGCYPLVQGHEVAGELVESRRVSRAPAIGTQVVVDPIEPCRDCYACSIGRENACRNLRVLGVHRPGAFAELVAVPGDRVHPVPDLPPDVAVLCEPVAVAFQAVERSGLMPGQDVLVIGAGGIGRAVTLVASDRGARVLVADRLPVRLRLAEAAGAAETVNTELEDLNDRVDAFTHGRGVGVVIEATGVPHIIAAALELVAPTGTVVVVGVSRSQLSMPVSVFTRKELTVVGSRNSVGQFPAAIDLVRRRRELIAGTVTHRFPLEAAARVFDKLTGAVEEIGKAIFEPGRPQA